MTRLRLARRSLILRLVGLSLLLLLIVQAAGFAVVRASIDRNARAQIARALDLDENIWRRLLDQNAEQLRQGSALLAADYGFRSAVNSGDEETIQSVLENHGSRIGAAVTAVLDTQLALQAVSVQLDEAAFRAVAGPLAARLAGINRRGLLFAVYAISGLTAGIAGIFATASVMTVDISRTGDQMEMDAILAVVIGGTSLAGGKFNLTGATIGALLIATLDKTVVFLGISSSATPAFKAIVIVVLCLLQSDRVRGWFTRRKAAPVAAETKEEVAA